MTVRPEDFANVDELLRARSRPNERPGGKNRGRMMIVQNGAVVFSVKFSHISEGLEGYFPPIHRMTKCSLVRATPDGEERAYGEALCSVRDQFCRDKGRKVSLAKAMLALGLNHAEREVIWKELLKTTKGSHRG